MKISPHFHRFGLSLNGNFMQIFSFNHRVREKNFSSSSSSLTKPQMQIFLFLVKSFLHFLLIRSCLSINKLVKTRGFKVTQLSFSFRVFCFNLLAIFRSKFIKWDSRYESVVVETKKALQHL